MTSNELLPCPFCAGPGKILPRFSPPHSHKPKADYWVGCETPFCIIIGRFYATRDEAVAAWNRRAGVASEALPSYVEPCGCVQKCDPSSLKGGEVCVNRLPKNDSNRDMRRIAREEIERDQCASAEAFGESFLHGYHQAMVTTTDVGACWECGLPAVQTAPEGGGAAVCSAHVPGNGIPGQTPDVTLAQPGTCPTCGGFVPCDGCRDVYTCEQLGCRRAGETTPVAPERPGIPAVLFDGHAVYRALTMDARRRTSAENVSDTLDAAVRLIRAEVETPEQHKVDPMKVTDEMVNRFLWWKLPRDFAPDCGISFDGRKPDQWNPSREWPVGTNLFTAVQARAMLEHVLGGETDAQP